MRPRNARTARRPCRKLAASGGGPGVEEPGDDEYFEVPLPAGTRARRYFVIAFFESAVEAQRSASSAVRRAEQFSCSRIGGAMVAVDLRTSDAHEQALCSKTRQWSDDLGLRGL